MFQATLNQSIPLSVVAADGRTDLFAQIRIYQGVSLLTTLSAPHIAEGLYSVDWTPSTEGYYNYVGQLYLDNTFTIKASYEVVNELIDVNDNKTNIMRIIGLHHDNAVLDQQTYDVNGLLISARLRIYDTKAHAQAGGVTGLLFEYSVLATYSSGKLNNYTMLREI